MSAPKLRVGDVCRCTGARVRDVRVVTVHPHQTGGEHGYSHKDLDGGGCGTALESMFILLRRRVEIGDSIRVRDGYDKRLLRWIVRGEALAATSPITVVELDRKSAGIHGIMYYAVEHADGAPIDWPMSAALDVPHESGDTVRLAGCFLTTPPGAHKVTDFEGGTERIKAELNDGRGRSESFAHARPTSFADMVDAIHPADAPKPATTASNIRAAKALAARVGIDIKEDPWMPEDRFAIVSRGSIHTGRLGDAIDFAQHRIENAHLTMRLDAEQKRATRLADECGDLSELHRLCQLERDELLVENAKLRRRVEQFETQAKKRR